jgi:CheY-like chemotaxis protein
MLGLTSYQEALRALGRLADHSSELRIVEHAASAELELASLRGSRRIGPLELEEIVVGSLAHRGEHRAAGDVADVLRSVGQALDQLHAREVCLAFSPERLSVRFSDQHDRSHELTYAGEELEALRRAAAARRNGQPLRRILILQATPDSAAYLVELLLAEFAVQALPVRYARAVALSSEPPDLILAQEADETIQALSVLRASELTVRVPIVAIAEAESDTAAAGAILAAGADDFFQLQQPVLPAPLRARIRTWLLRGRPGPYTVQ